MADEILQALNGCFLWVDLVLKELWQVKTSTEIRKVLASNSESMDGLYSKILANMAAAWFGKDLGKAYLIWAVCSFRPLSTREIHQVIEVDIKDTIDNVERSISTCCQNIVYVDSCKEVRLIYLTAQEFLLRQNIVPEFAIDKSSAHKRLTLACLRYLSSSEMKAPRSRTASLAVGGEISKKKQPFADYACKFIFQYLPHVKSTDDEVLAALTKFLLSPNILSWIAYLASHADLQLVFYAGKAINNLLARKSQHTPSVGLRRELVLLQQLGNDLIHLVTRFSKELLRYPLSIYNLVPPLCPRDSTLRRLFGSTQRGLSVHGLLSYNWDDCLSTFIYPKPAKPISVVTSPKYLAIGMSTGSIIVYDSVTCEESQVIDNQEPVWGLTFGETRKYLALFGAKTVRVWDLGLWAEWCTLTILSMCMTAIFIEEDQLLLAALKNSQLVEWDISSGGIAPGPPVNWTHDFDESYNILAVVYRGEDILLWDFELDRVHDIYGKESGSPLINSDKESDGSTTVWALVFSSALADAGLLVAAYSNGDLVIYDKSSGSVLEILNRFDRTPIGPRALAFTIDNGRLIDVRGNQCRIWDPIVLLRRDIDKVSSDTVSVSTNRQEIDYKTAETISITSTCIVPAASIVFYGKEDGSVHVYDIAAEARGAQQLFMQTPGVPVIVLYFDTEVGLLTCGDSAS
ncbi:quinon protein alcohol dehydrogenase-like superfamily [Aspergillus spinulosporus]